MKAKSLAALGAVVFLSLTACGSSKKASLTEATSAAGTEATSQTDNTPGQGLGTIPPFSVPNLPGVSSDCMALIQTMAGAFSGQDVNSLDALPEALNKLAATAPDNMQADFKTMAEGYAKLAKLYTKYNNDFTKLLTDPDAAKFFSDPAFTAAADRVSKYMETQCPSS
ncbi:unannotated protein [freshwater metagenome]|uniref:Unannotated protein n=1 Tax=freshwater metagenome TaxID=449393 RepID=A0A6J7FBS2_9ZZZZ|nr:hypothetical protein [Actinomycetota bacterium]